MNALSWSKRSLALLAAIILSGLFWAGCATEPKIDWKSRVGAYSYDQAVIDMGPPDRSAKLSDGTVVAQWLSRRGSSFRTFHMFYGSWLSSSDSPPSPDQFLTLTFDPESRLKEWKWIYK